MVDKYGNQIPEFREGFENVEDYEDLKKVLKALDDYSEKWSSGQPGEYPWLYQAMWEVKNQMGLKMNLTKQEFFEIQRCDQNEIDIENEDLEEKFFDDLRLDAP